MRYEYFIIANCKSMKNVIVSNIGANKIKSYDFIRFYQIY